VAVGFRSLVYWGLPHQPEAIITVGFWNMIIGGFSVIPDIVPGLVQP
jgi:hypothetical protein